MICSLLCASLALAPMAHVHAHVAGHADEHVMVHGGHVHDGAHQHHGDQDRLEESEHHPVSSTHASSDHANSHVVDLKPDLSRGNPDSSTVLKWIAAVAFAAHVLLELEPVDTTLPRPPDWTPPSSYPPFAVPLQRGPPRSV
jgi:hypothetical protein